MIRIRRPTPERSRPPRSLANEFTSKPVSEVGVGRQTKSSWATAPNGSGIWLICTFRARFRLSISITPANTCGNWRASCTPMMS